MSARILLAALILLLAPACAAPAANPKNRYVPGPPRLVKGSGAGYFAARDGTPLWEAWLDPPTPTAVVVIVHGLKDHASRYDTLAGELYGCGFAVRAFDLRGHGHSGGDRVWVDEFATYVDDLDVFLARVRKSEPGRPIYLFGHSMGGAIVTLYALNKKPADLAGLILSAPALRLDVAAPTRASAHVASTLTPSLAIMSLDDDLFSRDPAAVKAMRADPLIYDDNGPARTAGELLNAVSEIRDRMEEVKCPLLLLHGTKDQITMPDGSRELLSRAASTDKTLKLYEGCYHDLWHEPPADRERVASDLLSWLAARAKPK